MWKTGCAVWVGPAGMLAGAVPASAQDVTAQVRELPRRMAILEARGAVAAVFNGLELGVSVTLVTQRRAAHEMETSMEV